MSVKERGPAYDIEFVIVTDSMHVTAGIEQGADDVEVPVRRSPMDRISVVSGLACVGIRSVGQEQLYNVKMSMLGGRMQTGPAPVRRCSIRLASKIGIIGQQSANSLDVAPGARVEEERIGAGQPRLDGGF
jgi:hypothetical protein